MRKLFRPSPEPMRTETWPKAVTRPAAARARAATTIFCVQDLPQPGVGVERAGTPVKWLAVP